MPRRANVSDAALPEGFVYRPEFLSGDEEQQLLAKFGTLHFHPFDFQGYTAKRRIIEYGYEYDFSRRKASAAPPIPEFLFPFRDRAAQFAGIQRDEIVECVITQYPASAPIGWHRDVPQFEMIIGISLGSACRMRLKPYRAEGKLVSILLEPRSLYLMQGPARWKFQHSIPAVEQLRYSVTFRTLRKKKIERAD